MKKPEQIHAEVGWNLFHDSVYESTHRAFTVADITKIIADAKGGVCEWTIRLGVHEASCGRDFTWTTHCTKPPHYLYCPGCGKEIKIV
jgi:hypothetical protein